MGKALRNAIRLEKDWDSFQNEHPEIKLVKDNRGKILYLSIPEDYTINFLLLSSDKGEVIHLSFINPEHPNELVTYSS